MELIFTSAILGEKILTWPCFSRHRHRRNDPQKSHRPGLSFDGMMVWVEVSHKSIAAWLHLGGEGMTSDRVEIRALIFFLGVYIKHSCFIVPNYNSKFSRCWGDFFSFFQHFAMFFFECHWWCWPLLMNSKTPRRCSNQLSKQWFGDWTSLSCRKFMKWFFRETPLEITFSMATICKCPCLGLERLLLFHRGCSQRCRHSASFHRKCNIK